MSGAVFGDVQVSLFVAGAVLGEVQVSLFVAGAVFREVVVSLFVAGAALGECLNVRLGAKRCIFQEKMLVVSSKSNLRGEAGCGLRFHGRIMVGSWSDRSRIVPALEMTFSLVFRKFLPHVKWSFCVAGAIFGEVG